MCTAQNSEEHIRRLIVTHTLKVLGSTCGHGRLRTSQFYLRVIQIL